MKFKLENPQHQMTAIHSVVEVFRGMEKNTYDNAHIEDIHSNVCSLSPQELVDNIKRVIAENNVLANQSCIIESNDACIEMETGIDKTLTYIQTAYELYKVYGLTKFIVLVPSIPIRQDVIDTFDSFKEQLEDKYDVQANAFENIYEGVIHNGIEQYQNDVDFLIDRAIMQSPIALTRNLKCIRLVVMENCKKMMDLGYTKKLNKLLSVYKDADSWSLLDLRFAFNYLHLITKAMKQSGESNNVIDFWMENTFVNKFVVES